MAILEVARSRKKLSISKIPVAILFSLFFAINLVVSADAQSPVDEYRVKAAFIANFLRYIEWPAQTQAGEAHPLRVGILGDDPFEGGLEQALAGRSINGKHVIVERIERIDGLNKKVFQVLFVSRSEEHRFQEIFSETCDRPVLTIGDGSLFTAAGGIIGFYEENRKIRFEINRSCADRGSLKISSQLLKLAKIVDGPTRRPSTSKAEDNTAVSQVSEGGL